MEICMIQSMTRLTPLRSVCRRLFSISSGLGTCLLVALLAPGIVPAASLQSANPAVQQSGPAAAPSQQEAALLAPGKAIARTLTGSKMHRYQLKLKKWQCAAIHVEQHGINVVIQLLGSDDQPAMEVDDEPGKQGTEKLDIVASDEGTYTVVVKPKLKVASGAYEIHLAEVRIATDNDRTLYEVRQLRTKIRYLMDADRPQEALPLAQRALTLAQQALGPDDAYVGLVMTDLAEVLDAMRKGEEVTQGYERALQVLRAKLGAEHPQTLRVSSRLGNVYADLGGGYSKADQLLSQALESEERILGPEDPMVANTLRGLGRLHSNRGDYAKAERELLRALTILEGAGLTEDEQYAECLNILGYTYKWQNQFEKAGPYFERSLAIQERKFGPDSPSLAKTLSNLGIVASQRKDYAAAERYFLRSLALREKYVGPEHQDYAAGLMNLANVYSSEGDNKKALETHLRAFSIFEKTVEPTAQPFIMSLANIATLYSMLGDFENANRVQAKLESAVESLITFNLAIGSERQKLAFLDSVARRTDRTMSLNLQLEPDSSQAAAMAATVLLQRKGRALDATTDTLSILRRHSDPQDQALLDQLKEATAQLALVALQGPQKQSLEEHRKTLQDLQERKEKLENAISHHNEVFRAQYQAVTLEAVQSAIPADSALVEFLTYSPYDPNAETTAQMYGDLRYAVYVLHRNGAPRGIDLGKAKAIDDSIEKLRAALRDPGRSDAQQLARVVAAKVLEPIQPLIAGDKRLLISPDGQLNLIPFEALRDAKSRYLVERFSITYLATGRDLLRMQVPHPSSGVPVILADPLFGEPKEALVAGPAMLPPRRATGTSARRSVTTGADFSSLYFAPLEGTKAEARSIQALFPQARVLTGGQASAAALEQLKAPKILHIATHGFFLLDTGRQTEPRNGGRGATERETADLLNPLLRSGLALSGANLVKDGRGKGILTALEASNLDLWGTKLVTLSACDTGVGEVKDREGVYGLRRSFFLAGAETLVMSLWPVSDYVTREMMTSYYSGLKHGLGRGEALRQAELAMLKRTGRQHPFYWASFIQSGEWANLDGQR
jgi:CHAT domain-containing protein/tetratricopeptide (TPR) repeat protein